ncbi:DUF6421 family protein [Arthrobacter sp. UM1]|uniref:DUF6421 family protein n=1 Tax=Arthrobacter sp. UM1 TaxID=2766776 RepID=UPI001CF707DF|nr:DUF6421 family protein [Arthrobacter sp. UM1]
MTTSLDLQHLPSPADLPRPDELKAHPAWTAAKAACTAIAPHQRKDGSLVEDAPRDEIAGHAERLAAALEDLAELLPHDADSLRLAAGDVRAWAADGFGIPDFLDSLVAFAPASQRVDGLVHAVVFPMYTQNGSTDRRFEAVLFQVMWPEFIGELEASEFSNPLFLPIRFIDFTAGYDTNSAVLFPESVATSSTPEFTWGAIFQDREAARYRRVVRKAAEITALRLPEEAEAMLEDQKLAEEAFILWDLIHDRTHMRGELPFDPFMIKQRMPYFLYGLEELRCDLTAFRECVRLANDPKQSETVRHRARLVQYAVVFDRVFRFAVTGSRVRNYDGLGGQLLFAWLHQRRVLNWRDGTLDIDWSELPAAVNALGEEIEVLYWRSIDRPKVSHWLAAYELVSGTLTPHPASVWAKGPDALPTTGKLGLVTDELLDDEFPLSMFYEALEKKMRETVASTAGIVGTDA